jgi:hypothetical protein
LSILRPIQASNGESEEEMRMCWMLELRFANEHVALVVTFPLFFAIEHDIPIT